MGSAIGPKKPEARENPLKLAFFFSIFLNNIFNITFSSLKEGRIIKKEYEEQIIRNLIKTHFHSGAKKINLKEKN